MLAAQGTSCLRTLSLPTVLNETWKEQYERMKRSYRLLDEIGQPIAQKQNVLPPGDVLFYFCCDVLHLRDWIAATFGTDRASTRAIAEQLLVRGRRVGFGGILNTCPSL